MALVQCISLDAPLGGVFGRCRDEVWKVTGASNVQEAWNALQNSGRLWVPLERYDMTHEKKEGDAYYLYLRKDLDEPDPGPQ